MTQLVIVIGKTVDDKYYFRIRIDGSRILLTSREFVRIEKCMKEIYGIQQYDDFVIVEEYDRNNGHRYTLINTWQKELGESPYYTYLHEMKRDVELMRKLLRKAEVIDNSSLVRFFRPVRI